MNIKVRTNREERGGNGCEIEGEEVKEVKVKKEKEKENENG